MRVTKAVPVNGNCTPATVTSAVPPVTVALKTADPSDPNSVTKSPSDTPANLSPPKSCVVLETSSGIPELVAVYVSVVLA